MTYGTIIKSARVRAGLTQGELGARVKRSASQICAIETGQVVNPPSPDEMVEISDAVCDRLMLVEYCDSCQIRKRIVIHKFPRLNNIVPGPQVAMLKVMEKLASASDSLSQMLPKTLNKNFQADPDYREYRNEAVMTAYQVKHGIETLLEQWVEAGIITHEELKLLGEMHTRHCEERGHLVPVR